MKNLLRIDCSPRVQGSHSRDVADHYTQAWLNVSQKRQVVTRDLGVTNDIPHLSNETITAMQGQGCNSYTAYSDELIEELKAADTVLFSMPLYNFLFPSNVKAYLDHVVRSGVTFNYTEQGTTGLLSHKRAIIILACGGVMFDTDDQFVSSYMKKVLSLIGIEDVDIILVEGMALGEVEQKRSIAKTKKEIDALFEKKLNRFDYQGLTVKDRNELTKLSDGQVSAILAGDEHKYATLCCEDIVLSVPGVPLISGLDSFVQAEKTLFTNASFTRFEKTPLKIEVAGDLVIEIGVQKVDSKTEKEASVYQNQQKYTHMYRKVNGIWKYAYLSSSAVE